MNPSMFDIDNTMRMSNKPKPSPINMRRESLIMMSELFKASHSLDIIMRRRSEMRHVACHVLSCSNPQMYRVAGTNITYCKFHSKHAKMILRLYRIRKELSRAKPQSPKSCLKRNLIHRSTQMMPNIPNLFLFGHATWMRPASGIELTEYLNN